MHHACIRAHCRCPCCRRARASPRRQSRPSRSRRGALRSSAASASRRARPTAAPSAAAQPTAAASAVSPHCRVCVATAVLVGVPCMLRQPNQAGQPSAVALCCSSYAHSCAPPAPIPRSIARSPPRSTRVKIPRVEIEAWPFHKGPCKELTRLSEAGTEEAARARRLAALVAAHGGGHGASRHAAV